ncbi:hypothetical protein Esti_000417 [Eimeria stiedai]
MLLEVYIQFVEAVDAVDNGVSISKEGVLLYADKTTLSHRVASLYPSNNKDDAGRMRLLAEIECLEAHAQKQLERDNAEVFAAAAAARGHGFAPPFDWMSVPILGGSVEEVWRFRKALAAADKAFAATVVSLRDSWLPGLPVLVAAIQKKKELTDVPNEVVELNEWSQVEGHIYNVEKDLGLSPLCFMVYPSERQHASGYTYTAWTVRCVSEEGQPFCSRWPLLQAFRGLRDDALGEVVLKGFSLLSSSALFVALLVPSIQSLLLLPLVLLLLLLVVQEAAYEMIYQTLEAKSLEGDTQHVSKKPRANE